MIFLQRKMTRGDCKDGPRPCQIECRYRLEGAESCALDVADRGGSTQDDVAAAMGISATVVAYYETRGLAMLCKRLGVPVPAKLDYTVEIKREMDHGARDEFDDDVFATIGRLPHATPANVAQAVGRHIATVRAAIDRLVDDGRITRIRLKKIQKAFAYEIVEGEAAE